MVEFPCQYKTQKPTPGLGESQRPTPNQRRAFAEITLCRPPVPPLIKGVGQTQRAWEPSDLRMGYPVKV